MRPLTGQVYLAPLSNMGATPPVKAFVLIRFVHRKRTRTFRAVRRPLWRQGRSHKLAFQVGGTEAIYWSSVHIHSDLPKGEI